MTSPRVRSRAPRLVVAALVVAAALVLGAALAGCGDGRTGRTPPLRRVPLVPGATVRFALRQCDSGANPYCALNAIIVDTRYRTSHDLMEAERRLLKAAHWSSSFADTGLERAAESPGHRLRLTYATADDDLRAIDQQYIKRPPPIAMRLSKLDFAGTPALSVLLEAGSS